MATVPDAVTVRQTNEHDAALLANLRRSWSEEQSRQSVDDSDFEERFAEWYAAEASRRVSFLAEFERQAVGMVNLTVFDRMPRPGRAASHWCYLGNAFVLASHRNRGIGTVLLEAATSYARDRGAARIVLSPSDRSVPFYQRAGFGPATMLLAKRLA